MPTGKPFATLRSFSWCSGEKLAKPGTAVVARPASSSPSSREAPPQHADKASAPQVSAPRLKPPIFMWGKKPHHQRPCFHDLYKFTSSRPCRSRRPARFLPMLQGGLLVVPPEAVSGYREIDSKNKIVATLYTQISDVLEKEHKESLIAKITKCIHTMDGEVLKNLRALRTEAFQIRRSIISSGAIPLSEPVAYWRWKYSLVAF